MLANPRRPLHLMFGSAAGVLGLCAAVMLWSSTGDHAQALTQQAAVPAPRGSQPRNSDGIAPASGDEAAFVGVLLPEQATDVSAAQSGMIEAVHVALGEVVEAGQLLVSLSVKQATLEHLRASAELSGARAGLSRSRVEQAHAVEEAERSRRLAQEGLATAAELAQARFKLQESRALTAEAQSRLQERTARVEQLAAVRDQTRITASFSGRVALRYVSPGAQVGAGTPLLRLISDQAVLLRFAVPESVVDLQAGSSVSFTPSAQPDSSFAARVVRVSPEIDAASRMRTIEAVPLEAAQVIDRGLVGAIVSVRGVSP